MKDIIASAKAASKAKDWPEAARLWQQAIGSRRKPCPENYYRNLAHATLQAGDAVAACRQAEDGLQHYPDSRKLKTVKAEALYLAGQYDAAMQLFEELGSEHGDFVYQNLILGRLDAIHKRMQLSKQERLKSWGRVSGPLAWKSAAAREALDAGDITQARARLHEVVEAYFPDAPVLRATWQEVVDRFCDCVVTLRGTGREAGPAPRAGGKGVAPASGALQARTIFVSGMGWSGSTALTDYFCEFPGVQAVRTEYRHIEGNAGLKLLRRSLSGDPDFASAFMDFFFANLLGSQVLISGDKSASRTKLLVLGKHGQDYANGALALCRTVQERAAEPDRRALLAEMGAITLRMIAETEQKQDAEVIIFDNLVHIYNLDLFSLFRDAAIFCCFRDPRSNYVSRLREDKRFTGSAEDFIESYRKRRAAIDRKIRRLAREQGDGSEPGNVLHQVQFENFVLSRAYRRDLAAKAGISLAQQDEFAHFRPWESERNVFNFETYEKPEEIRLIEHELSEYCIDLEKLKDEVKQEG